MKITIELPSHFYETEWVSEDGSVRPPSTNKAREVLATAETDWKDFAFEMADILGEKLNEMSEEHERESTHLDKCFHQPSLL